MSEELTLISAFLVGLFGGVHCVGMCGGIVGALSMNLPQNNTRSTAQFPLLLLYNLGRITSYTIAGLLAGGFGWWASNWLFIHKAQLILQVIAALFMILLGLYLANWWRILTVLERAGSHVWRHIEPVGRRFLPVKTSADAMVLGLVWGWLPCGLVYSVLIWSISTGSAIDGALLMLSFGLGTLPNLLLMGIFSQRLTQFFQLWWLRVTAGVLIIGFASLMLLRVFQTI